jgi:group I intron endonuclease
MEIKYNVYKIICLLNHKVYIGYTKHNIYYRFRQHINKSKYNHVNKFLNAIRYYGVENFRIELLISVSGKEDALKNEIQFIKEHNSIENGYNTRKGGNDGSTGQKKGYVFSEEHKKNISLNHHDTNGEKNPFYGKTHTEESRKKISKNHAKVPWLGGKTSGSFKQGKEHPNSKQITINGVLYESISLACKSLNLHRRKIMKLSNNP